MHTIKFAFTLITLYRFIHELVILIEFCLCESQNTFAHNVRFLADNIMTCNIRNTFTTFYEWPSVWKKLAGSINYRIYSGYGDKHATEQTGVGTAIQQVCLLWLCNNSLYRLYYYEDKLHGFNASLIYCERQSDKTRW